MSLTHCGAPVGGAVHVDTATSPKWAEPGALLVVPRGFAKRPSVRIANLDAQSSSSILQLHQGHGTLAGRAAPARTDSRWGRTLNSGTGRHPGALGCTAILGSGGGRTGANEKSWLATANVTCGHPPELEACGSARDDWVLSSKLAQCLLVLCLDNREAVRVLVGEDRPEHDHLAALKVRAPVSSVAVHDFPLRVGQRLGEVRARSNQTQDERGHGRDSTSVVRRITSGEAEHAVPRSRPAQKAHLPFGSRTAWGRARVTLPVGSCALSVPSVPTAYRWRWLAPQRRVLAPVAQAP
jgi:hypothetical protein